MTDSGDKTNFLRGLGELGIIGITDITGNVISALFWLYMAMLLGAENYGQVSDFLSIGSIISTVSVLGLPNTLSVYLPKNIRLESTAYLIPIIVGMIAFVILFFVFSNASVSTYVIGMIFASLAGSEIMANRQYRIYPKYLIVSKILMVGLSIGLYHVMGVNGVILGLGLAFLPYLGRIYKGFKETKIDFSLLKSRMRFMMNSLILDLSPAFKGSIDKLIIAQLVGFTLLGNYTLGLQFLGLMRIVPQIVYKYTLPHDAQGILNKKLKSMTVLYSIGIAILSILLTPIIIPSLFPEYTGAIEVIQIVSISVVPFTISMFFLSEFLGNEKVRVVLFGSGISLAVFISLMILLGRSFGINGIASGIVFAEIAETIFYYLVRKFNVKYLLR